MRTQFPIVTVLLIGCLTAFGEPAASPTVAILRKIQKQPTKWSNQKLIDSFVERLSNRLETAGLTITCLDDDKVGKNSFGTIDVLFLPYNPDPPFPVVSEIRNYVKRGGKIFLFYCSNPDLLRLVGIESVQYLTNDGLPKLQGISITAPHISGLPKTMRQASWNIYRPEKLRPDVNVIAEWIDTDGKTTGIPALTAHPNGYALGHVYLDQEPEAGAKLFLALLGHIFPGIWSSAAERHRNATLEELGVSHLSEMATGANDGRSSEAIDKVSQASRLFREAGNFLSDGKGYAALEQSRLARKVAEEAWLMSSPSRSGELRGAWIHSAYGIADWGWDRTVKVLADHGFNAIFPNMCWGTVADYPSDVLPVHPNVQTRGDQIEQCLNACRKYGIEIHVWKVNWNMGSHTPADIRQRFISAGRTQVDVNGQDSTFLAPHLEENFTMERDAMLEIAERYPVDGIHFDYIRYPGDQCDFSNSARTAFEKNLGREVAAWPADCRPGGALRREYNQWRRNNITRLVRSVSERAREIRPGIAISAAVFGAWDTAPESVAQATTEWIQDGLLDFVCPMNYTNSDARLERLLRPQLKAIGGKIPLYAGIGSWRHNSPIQTAKQIQLARSLGADGFVCFALNEHFAEDVLPALSLGVARIPAAPMPHHAESVAFEIPSGEEDLQGALQRWTLIEIRALTDTQGYQVGILRNGIPTNPGTANVRSRRGNIIVTFQPDQEGMYQVELRRNTHVPGKTAGSGESVIRSPAVEVLSDGEYQARLRMSGPPEFAGSGKKRVAVWHHDAYGAEPLLKALAASGQFDAAPLLNLKPETLAACDVIILMQPRADTHLFKNDATRDALAAYVRRGGGIMCMHALVGIRDFLPIVPAIGTGGERIPGNEWQASRKHPVTAGITREKHTATFTDRISIVPGKRGITVAVSPENTPLVVVGKHGRGRVVYCGLGVGIGAGDTDTPPSEQELRLITNAIAWLAR